MTQAHEPNPENFFDNVGGGFSPTAKLKDVGDFVVGEVVEQRVVDYIPFGKTEPETNRDGSIRKQLVVTLQTDLRNWQNVARIPKVDKDNPNSAEKDPSEDDGRRAIYLPQYSNIQAAVAAAIAKSNGGRPGPVRIGAKLGVKVHNLRDTGKGNPLKEHQAHYEPPAESNGFFDSAPAASTPEPQAQPPLAQGSSFGGGDRGLDAPAPAAQAPAPAAEAPPAAQGDPWGNTGASQGGAPF